MRKKIDLPEVEPVVLKPILGMRPGAFILLVICLLIVFAFFLLFVLPGLLSGGSYVCFDSKVANIGIVADGTYLGSTEGSRYYMDPGKHEMVYLFEGTEVGRETLEVPRHIFFTLFYHPTMDRQIEIEDNEELETLLKNTFLDDLSRWSKITSLQENFHRPQLISDFAESAIALGFSSVEEEMYAALLRVSSLEMAEDYNRAASMLQDAGYQIRRSDFDPGVLFLEDPETISASHSNQSYDNYYSDGFHYYAGGDIELGRSTTFSYPETNVLPQTVQVDAFALQRFPVSEYDWALFVEANPYWGKDNKEVLIDRGLVDEYYLDGVYLSTGFPSSKPIRNISYYSALAYIEYVSQRDNVEYRLPTEAEWEMAAEGSDVVGGVGLGYRSSDLSKPSGMLGLLWQFTSSSYLPLSRVLGEDDTSSLSNDNDDIIIKGGSYLNSDVQVSDVGLIDRSATSEYVGLRLAKDVR